MILPQHLHIHAGLIIVALRKAAAHDLCQVLISLIIFRKEHQMIIAVVPARQLPVEAGIWRNVYLAAQNRVDALLPRRPVKIDHAVHCAVIRDRRRRHSKLFDALYIFFDLIGAVQQTVFRVDVQMRKCHTDLFLFRF